MRSPKEAVMKRSLSHLVLVGAIAATVVVDAPSLASAGHHGAHVVVPPGQAGPRVGPSSLYPDPTLTPRRHEPQHQRRRPSPPPSASRTGRPRPSDHRPATRTPSSSSSSAPPAT